LGPLRGIAEEGSGLVKGDEHSKWTRVETNLRRKGLF